MSGEPKSSGFAAPVQMSAYQENRPAVNQISLLIKDTRSIFTIDLRNKTANMVRNANYPNNTNFPHNFCCV